MGMIAQSITVIQDALTNVLRDIPIAMTDGKTDAYILVKDLPVETEEFVLTGKCGANELHALPDAYERELTSRWRSLGFTCKHHSQPIDYMNRRVTIKYLRVSNPETGFGISLIPWFMLPGRPFPVFAYVYAVWHYNSSARKSMRLSAAAVGKIFGIASFNKSTVCRNIKAMEHILGNLRMDAPLPINELAVPATAEIVGRIPEILKGCPTIESLVKACAPNTVQLPPPVRQAKAAAYAMSLIPDELGSVIKGSAIARERGDSRKRPNQRRTRGDRPVQRSLTFVEFWRIEHIRRKFIAICRAAVLGAALKYHRFLS